MIMKVSKLFKLIKSDVDVVIYGVDSNEPIYQGLPGNTPYYLTQLTVANVEPIGQDKYASLLLVLERGLRNNDSK